MSVPKEVVQAREAMATAIREKLGTEFFSHSVVFARTPIRQEGPPETGLKYLVGSGTLVKLDADDGNFHYGVLTCGHVLGELDRPMEGTHGDRLTLLIPSHATGPVTEAYAATVPFRTRTPFTEGAKNKSSLGPDLAWFPLARNEARSLENTARSRAVFYSLTKGLEIIKIT